MTRHLQLRKSLFPEKSLQRFLILPFYHVIDAATGVGCSVKKVFLKVSQNLNRIRNTGLQLY